MILLPARYLWSEIFKIIINHLQFFFIETFVLLLLYFNICGTQVSIMIRTGKCSFGQVNLTDLSVRMTGVLKALFHSSDKPVSLERNPLRQKHYQVSLQRYYKWVPI